MSAKTWKGVLDFQKNTDERFRRLLLETAQGVHRDLSRAIKQIPTRDDGTYEQSVEQIARMNHALDSVNGVLERNGYHSSVKSLLSQTPKLHAEVVKAFKGLGLPAGFSTTAENQLRLLSAATFSNFANIGKQGEDTLRRELGKSLAAGSLAKDADVKLRELLMGTGQKDRAGRGMFVHAATLAGTAMSQIERASTKQVAQEVGVRRFLYSGGLIATSRPFCVEHNGKEYTTEQIARMDNGMTGGDVMVDMGGWNCRHSWIPIVGKSDVARLREEGEHAAPPVDADYQQTSDTDGTGATDLARFSSLDIGQRHAQFNALSQEARDRLGDPLNTIPRAVRQLLGDEPFPETEHLHADVKSRLTQFTDRVLPARMERLDTVMREYVATLEASASRADAREMAKAVTDHLLAGEIEASSRTLGDHGLRHVFGNVEIADSILSKMLGDAYTPAMKARLLTVSAFHDVGYLTPPARMFMDDDHPRWGADYFAGKYGQLANRIWGPRAAGEMAHMIETHAGTTFDWQNDPHASAYRFADNLALFWHEKLPSIFEQVPLAQQALVALGGKRIDVATAKAKMKAAVLAQQGISDGLRAQYLAAVEEVSPVLPKFTLGQYGGKLRETTWVDTATEHYPIAYLERTPPWALAEYVDMGQRQFGKLAETYGHTTDDFLAGRVLQLHSKDGKVVAEFRVVGRRALEVTPPDADQIAKGKLLPSAEEKQRRDKYAALTVARRRREFVAQEIAKQGVNIEETIVQLKDPEMETVRKAQRHLRTTLAASGEATAMKESDRNKLLARLSIATQEAGIPAVALDYVSDFLKMMPADMTKPLLKVKFVGSAKAGRAYASASRNELKIYSTTEPTGVVHELAHHIPYNDPKVQKATAEFYLTRTKGSKPELAYDWDPLSTDIVRRGGFYDPYVGRDYANIPVQGKMLTTKAVVSKGRHEVFSVGAESLFNPAMLRQMARRDPDHLYLILSSLKGNPEATSVALTAVEKAVQRKAIARAKVAKAKAAKIAGKDDTGYDPIQSDAAKQLVKRAVKKIGTTTDPTRAGFILPTGRMLDLWNPAAKDVTHVEIGKLYPKGEMKVVGRFQTEASAVRIRFGGGGLYLEISEVPTARQLDAVSAIITKNRPAFVTVDITKSTTPETIKDDTAGFVQRSKQFIMADASEVKAWVTDALPLPDRKDAEFGPPPKEPRKAKFDITPIAQETLDTLEAKLGTTDAPEEAGFLLPGGRLLKLTERAGRRSMAHEDVLAELPAAMKRQIGYDAAKTDFNEPQINALARETRMVRFDFSDPGTGANEIGVEFSAPPTRRQVNEIMRLAHETGARVLVDVTDEAAKSTIGTKRPKQTSFVVEPHEMSSLPTKIESLFGKPTQTERAAAFAAAQPKVKADETRDTFTPTPPAKKVTAKDRIAAREADRAAKERATRDEEPRRQKEPKTIPTPIKTYERIEETAPFIPMGFKDRLGNCYELAGRRVAFAPQNSAAKLVHGTITDAQTGKAIAHAWVEEAGVVYDAVLGVSFTKENYYQLMQAKVYKTYGQESVNKQILKTSKWGPWDKKSDKWYEENAPHLIVKPKSMETRLSKTAKRSKKKAEPPPDATFAPLSAAEQRRAQRVAQSSKRQRYMQKTEADLEEAFRWRQARGASSVRDYPTRPEYRQAAKKLPRMVKSAKVVIRMPEYFLDDIIAAGRYKTQFESHESQGMYNPSRRRKLEKKLFGLGNIPAKQRPAYGYLQDPKDLGREPYRGVMQYGNVKLVLKESVKKRTTWTAGDSLDDGAPPSPVLDPSPVSLIPGPDGNAYSVKPVKLVRSVAQSRNIGGAAGSARTYFEAQIHGGVRMEDIAEVRFDGKADPEVVWKLKKQYGIVSRDKNGRVIQAEKPIDYEKVQSVREITKLIPTRDWTPAMEDLSWRYSQARSLDERKRILDRLSALAVKRVKDLKKIDRDISRLM